MKSGLVRAGDYDCIVGARERMNIDQYYVREYSSGLP